MCINSPLNVCMEAEFRADIIKFPHLLGLLFSYIIRNKAKSFEKKKLSDQMKIV